MSQHRSKSEPYILAAPNGARRGAADHPALPVTTVQILEAARACHEAGAAGLHLHIRDTEGRHSLDAGQYLETLAELRRRVPALDIQITTEAAGIFDVSSQFECLRKVRPAWASISVREIARDNDLADRIYGLCADQGTRVQHILYDAEDAALLTRWQKRGVVREQQSDRLLVLGRYRTDQESKPSDLDAFPDGDSPWMICAFGKQEHDCLVHAASLGGDVRVGFENSIADRNGDTWDNNAASVAALVARLKEDRS